MLNKVAEEQLVDKGPSWFLSYNGSLYVVKWPRIICAFLENLTVAKGWEFEVVPEVPMEQTTPRSDTVHLSWTKSNAPEVERVKK